MAIYILGDSTTWDRCNKRKWPPRPPQPNPPIVKYAAPLYGIQPLYGVVMAP